MNQTPLLNKSGLLVHQIGPGPSFDQVLAFERDDKAAPVLNRLILTNIASDGPVDISSTKIEGIRLTKQLYLETQDFK